MARVTPNERCGDRLSESRFPAFQVCLVWLLVLAAACGEPSTGSPGQDGPPDSPTEDAPEGDVLEEAAEDGSASAPDTGKDEGGGPRVFYAVTRGVACKNRDGDRRLSHDGHLWFAKGQTCNLLGLLFLQ